MSAHRGAVARVRVAIDDSAPDFTAPGRTGVDVQFYGMLGSSVSIANVCTAVARELRSAFPQFALLSYNGSPFLDPALEEFVGRQADAPVGVFFGLPHQLPADFHRHRVRIGGFVCETDQIHPDWVDACNSLDLVVVPSTFCRQAFINSGVSVPVMIVPHGVDPAFHPRQDARPADRFVFFNTFDAISFSHRKSLVELVRCFLRAFPHNDDIVLRLRTQESAALRGCRGQYPFGNRIELDTSTGQPLETFAQVFSQVHCTVHPSKGEGFGMIPMQSIACETPVITPAQTGLADFIDSSNAVCLEPGPWIRAERKRQQIGRYRAVNEEHLVECMRSMVDEWPLWRERMKLAGPAMRRRFAWPQVLAEFIELVKALVDASDRASALRCIDQRVERAPVDQTRHRLEGFARCGYREATERGAPASKTREEPGKSYAVARFPFQSVVYGGWDYPLYGIGAHVRLFDSLVFGPGSGIVHRSLDEHPVVHTDGLYEPVRSFTHRQCPWLFQDCLYIDLARPMRSEEDVQRQAVRVRAMRRDYRALSVLYLMWETDTLWPGLVDLACQYNLCVVTSDLVQEQLRAAGACVRKLPHPYVYTTIGSDERASPAEGRGGPVTFGVSAGLWPRKNIPALAEAYARTLGNDPGCRLRIHTRTDARFPGHMGEYDRLLGIMKQSPGIQLEATALCRADYEQWFRSLDVYCFVSSGEGYSITPREALHLGIPVILLNAHVHREFAHLPGVLSVPSAGTRPASVVDAPRGVDIGHEAAIDTAALDAALLRARNEHSRLRCELLDSYGEVLDHHDVGVVQAQWRDALTQAWQTRCRV